MIPPTIPEITEAMSEIINGIVASRITIIVTITVPVRLAAVTMIT